MYEPDVDFGRKDGFDLAFALTPYAGDMSQRHEDPSNYTMEAMMYTWWIPENSLVTKYESKII